VRKKTCQQNTGGANPDIFKKIHADAIGATSSAFPQLHLESAVKICPPRKPFG
jgi:hypothetical protein